MKNFLIWFKDNTIAWITFAPQSRPRRATKSLIFSLVTISLKNNFIKETLLVVVNHFPKIKHRLKQIKNTNYENIPLELHSISSRQRDIYEMLKNTNTTSKKL